MSRIGKKIIPVPKGVTAKVLDGAVELQGPKGKLRQAHPAGIAFVLEDGHLVAKLESDDPQLGSLPSGCSDIQMWRAAAATPAAAITAISTA